MQETQAKQLQQQEKHEAALKEHQVEQCILVESAAATNKTSFSNLAFITFFIIGTVQLIGWNSLLNATNTLLLQRFNGANFVLTITATYSTVIVLATCLYLKFAKLSVKTLYTGLVLSAGLALAYALTAQLANKYSVSPMLHIIGGTMAVCSALVGSSGFGYAATFPTDYSGAMSAGLGMSGVLSFSVWMIFAYAVFPGTRIVGAVWVLSCVIILCSLGAIALVMNLFQRNWVKDALNVNVDFETLDKMTLEVGTFEQGGLSLVLKKVWWLSLSFLFHMMITLIVFPAIGPFSWGLKHSWQNDVLMGVFQLGDLIGRYLPNVVPILRVNCRSAIIFIACRLIFLLTFILSFKLQTTAVFGAYWFHVIQQLLMALTNGWLCTVCFMRIPELVEGKEAKAKAGSVALLSVSLGIAIGQWIGFGISRS